MRQSTLVIIVCSVMVSIVCVPLASRAPAAQTSLSDSLTLERAVNLTLSNHPAVAQALQGMVAAEARIGTSRSFYYPDLYFSGIYVRIDPVPELDFPPIPKEKLAPNNNYDFHLGLRQNVYDFNRTATSVDLARSGYKTASDYVEQVKSTLAYRAISLFNMILILRQSVEVLDDQIEALGQHLVISQRRVEAGTATGFDVLTTQVRIAAAKNERIDTANALQTQEIMLRELTGLPKDRPMQLKGDFNRVPLSLDADSLMEVAAQQRPEMIIAKDAEKSASIQMRLSSLGDKPSLSLDLTSGFKNGYFPDLNKLKANLSAGVMAQVPIFNGSRTHHQKDEAEANLRSAGARIEDIRLQIVADVEQALADAEASLEKIENAELQVKQAAEAVSIAKVRYEAGVVTNLDLLDAQTTLTQAELNHLRALFNYVVSLTAVDRATGRKMW